MNKILKLWLIIFACFANPVLIGSAPEHSQKTIEEPKELEYYSHDEVTYAHIAELDRANSSKSSSDDNIQKQPIDNIKNYLIDYYNNYSHDSAKLKDSAMKESNIHVKLEILSFIREHQLEINTLEDSEQNTLLILAAKFNYLEIAEYLIKIFQFTNLDAHNNYKKTALDYAQLHNNQAMIDLIQNSKKNLKANQENIKRLNLIAGNNKGKALALQTIQERVRLQKQAAKNEQERQLRKEVMDKQVLDFKKRNEDSLRRKYFTKWKLNHAYLKGMLKIHEGSFGNFVHYQDQKNIRKSFMNWKKALKNSPIEKRLEEKARKFHQNKQTKRAIDQLKKHDARAKEDKAMSKQADDFFRENFQKRALDQWEKYAISEGKNKYLKGLNKKADQFARVKALAKIFKRIQDVSQLNQNKRNEQATLKAREFEKIFSEKDAQQVNAKTSLDLVHQIIKEAQDASTQSIVIEPKHDQEARDLAVAYTRFDDAIKERNNKKAKLKHFSAMSDNAQAINQGNIHLDPYWHERYVGDASAINVRDVRAAEIKTYPDLLSWWQMHQENNDDCDACDKYGKHIHNTMTHGQRRKSF